MNYLDKMNKKRIIINGQDRTGWDLEDGTTAQIALIKTLIWRLGYSHKEFALLLNEKASSKLDLSQQLDSLIMEIREKGLCLESILSTRKLLIVVDMQEDFVRGALGSSAAEKIVPKVKEKIDEHRMDDIIFLRDTHGEDYLETQEGKLLPIVHCIKGTAGHRIIPELDTKGCAIFNKPTFGYAGLGIKLEERYDAGDFYDEIELCGLCTDICIVSNALLLKAEFPETTITVDASCCAGTSEENHRAALLTMKSCQVNII